MARITTITGDLDPEKLGPTCVHEHILLDLTFYHHAVFKYPLEASKAKLAESKLTIENLAVSKRDQFLIKDALRLDEEDVAVAELQDFKSHGGNCVVEVTVPGLGRDISGLRRIADKAEINVVAATGWYVAISHPSYVKEKSIDQLAEIMIKELTEGIEDTGIRAGVIKCAVGGVTGDPRAPLADYPFHPDEEKVLRAGVRAQKATNSAITLHPCIFRRDCHAYVDVLEEEGANLEKFWMSHMSATFPELDVDYCRSLIDRGISISFDNFGYEKYSQFTQGTCITDKERVKALVELCQAGYDRSIMLAHDNGQKDRLKRYGGDGYSHVLQNIVPQLRDRGVTETQIRNMLVENPKRMLAH